MVDEESPSTNNSDDSNPKIDFEDKELEKMHKLMHDRDEIFKNMSEYEQKLIKGIMRGFANTLILWLISQKRQHGYEIMTKLHESSPYESKMPSASKIYPVLHDLERNELIKGSWEHRGKRKIKYYEITKNGEETISRFKIMAQFARKNKSSIWVEFMKDMFTEKDDKELNL